MFKVIKYSILGAILAVSASGSFGLDAPDFLIAAIGGTAGAILTKAMLLI